LVSGAGAIHGKFPLRLERTLGFPTPQKGTDKMEKKSKKTGYKKAEQ